MRIYTSFKQNIKKKKLFHTIFLNLFITHCFRTQDGMHKCDKQMDKRTDVGVVVVLGILLQTRLFVAFLA